MVAFYLMKFTRLCERRSWCHHCWSGAVKTRFWRSRLQKRRASLSKTWPLGSSSLLDNLSTRRSHGGPLADAALCYHIATVILLIICVTACGVLSFFVVIVANRYYNLITRHSSSTLCCGRTDLEWMLSSDLHNCVIRLHHIAEYAATIPFVT